MKSVESDMETIEKALRLFFQTVKRPQHWAAITAKTGINIDRPSAVILHMLVLKQANNCRVQDLANQLGIEAPSVTRKTQELEQAGYIRRVPSKKDGRAVELEVTPMGRNANKKLWKVQREGMTHVLSNWSDTDSKKFADLFERFSQDIADYYQVNTK